MWERFTYSSLARLARKRLCGTDGWSAAEEGCQPVHRGSTRGKLKPNDDAFMANPALVGNDALDTLLHVLKARLLSKG